LVRHHLLAVDVRSSAEIQKLAHEHQLVTVNAPPAQAKPAAHQVALGTSALAQIALLAPDAFVHRLLD
jgi:plasmid replication initiation protein